jgi:hypothetical protein
VPSATPCVTGDAHASAAAVWRALAPGLAGAPLVRVGRWDHSELVFTTNQKLADLPRMPAALRIYDDSGMARALALDFDPHKADGGVARVESDVTAAVELLEAAGGRVVVDVSTRGGRHVWAPLAAPVDRSEILLIAAALQKLFPSLDLAPLRSIATGALTGPGSATKEGGHRRLLTPLPAAVAAVAGRSHPRLLDRLRERLAPAALLRQPDAAVRVDERAVARSGGPRPLTPLVLAIAEQGIWPGTRRTVAGQLWTGSEARQSLLASCAARGWSLADVRRQLQGGQWPGLAGLYAKYGHNSDAQLQRDWATALRYASDSPAPTAPPRLPGGPGTAVAQGHTSRRTTTHPPGAPHLARALLQPRDEYRHLRRLYSTVEIAAQRGLLGDGEVGRTRWAVLRSLIVMGMRCGSRYIKPGTRSLTFGSGLLDHSTVAAVLRELRAEEDGWIDLVKKGRGHEGDLYELRIPDRYSHLHAAGVPLPSGPLRDVHPVYAELRLSAWRVLETIEAGARDVAVIAEASGVSRAQVYRLVKVLEAVRLIAPRAAGGWRRTRRTLSAAARSLGVLDGVADRRARYRDERDAWRCVLAERGRQDWAQLAWMTSVDGPIWWPEQDQLEPPPNDPDPPTETEAMRLLVAAFDAVVLTA